MLWSKKKKNTKVVGIALDKNSAGIAVVDELSPDQIERVETINAPPGEFGPAIKQWVAAHDLEGAVCHLVVQADQVALLQSKTPEVPPEEMTEALRWSIKDSLDFPAEEAVIDHFPVPTDSIRSERKDVLNVIAVKRQVIEQALSQLQGVGLTLKSIDIPVLALRNLTTAVAVADKTIALLVVEGTTGSLFIFKNNLLYLSRQIVCPAVIYEGNGTPDATASALEQLTLEIQRSLDYFESQLVQVPPQSILVCAGHSTSAVIQHIDANLAITPAIINCPGIDHEDSAPLMLRAAGAALRKEAA